jgi:hypothetical protein
MSLAPGPTQPLIQLTPGVFLCEAKLPGREAHHSSPNSAEGNNAWSYTSTCPRVFMVWYLIKHWDSFAFTIILCNVLLGAVLPYTFSLQRLVYVYESTGELTA